MLAGSNTVSSNLLGAIATIVTAYLVWTIAKAQKNIAHEQKEIARAKLRLDLFTERYALYETLWSFLSARVGNLDHVAEVTARLQNSAPKFYFFFGDEIGKYATEALGRGLAQDISYRVSSHPVWTEARDQSASRLNDSYM
jgi:hypothetical protein